MASASNDLRLLRVEELDNRAAAYEHNAKELRNQSRELLLQIINKGETEEADPAATPKENTEAVEAPAEPTLPPPRPSLDFKTMSRIKNQIVQPNEKCSAMLKN